MESNARVTADGRVEGALIIDDDTGSVYAVIDGTKFATAHFADGTFSRDFDDWYEVTGDKRP